MDGQTLMQNDILVQVKRDMCKIRTVEIIKVMKGFICNKFVPVLLIVGKRWQMAPHRLRSGHA